MKKQLVASLGASVLALSGAANAAFLLDDWTLDVSGQDGLSGSNTVVNGINQMSFLAEGLSVTNDTDGNGLPTAGETFDIFANGSITGFQDNTSTNISPTFFNNAFSGTVGGENLDGWEMSFTFEVSGAFFDVDLVNGNSSFTHLAAGLAGTSGELKFFVDNISDGTGQASVSNGTGITDGSHIATFLIRSGDGGVFSFLTGDGADDATFDLLSASPGVFLDADGDDLTADGVLVASSDGNFDSNPGGAGPFSLDIGAFNCGNSPTNFCFREDGSFAIPEPGILALLGAGVLGLTLTSRRRKTS